MTLTEKPYLAMALNNAWANATLYGAVTGLDRAAFNAARPGFFGSLCATLNHIYEVDLFYVDALTTGGHGRGVFDRSDLNDAGDLARAQAASDMTLASFCCYLSAADLASDRSVERRHALTHERIDALLLHLFQHQIHHRGQAHVQLQEAGIAPPQLDDFYLTDGRAPSAQSYFG